MREFFTIEGFKFNAGIRASNYFREDKEWEYYISFDNMFIADSIQVTCSGAALAHKPTEAIFKKIIDKHPELPKVTVTFTDHNQYNLSDTRTRPVKSENDLIEVIGVWKKETEGYILPFFERWNDLKKIDTEIVAEIPPKDAGRYIPCATLLKKSIIMKLTGDAHYQDFVLERENAFRKVVSEGKEEYTVWLDAWLDLRNLLEQ
ncbi:MAG TPA: hypothetical protein VK518_14395 [Puia sp.]|nr:hypothetical protein [Puia sp.]